MDTMQLTKAPVMKTGMLIRRPVADVFEAFIDPAITTNFWFTKSTGRLEVGREVRWAWEMYGIDIPVKVIAVEPEARLVIEWPGQPGSTQGFSLVLAGLKALLEHGIRLNLVADRYPPGIEAH